MLKARIVSLIAICAIELWSLSVLSQTALINTVVGGNIAGYTLPANPPTSVSIGYLAGVAVDPSSGDIYVSDVDHRVVWHLNVRESSLSVVAGNGAFGNSLTLAFPTGLAVDNNGNLYIADRDAGVIYKTPTSGGVLQVVAGCGGSYNSPTCPVFPTIGDGGPATSAFIEPYSVSVDGSGNVFIADTFHHRIRKVDSVSRIITTVAGSSPGFGGDGGPATSAQLDFPQGVYVDNGGNIFIADTFNYRVREVFASNGTIQTIAGGGIVEGDGGPATSAILSNPWSVFVDSQGVVYVGEYARLRDVKNGIIQTVAGTGTPGYSTCPPAYCEPNIAYATSAPVTQVSGIAGSGINVVIADQTNFRIRMIDILDNKITSVVGNGQEDSVADGLLALGGFELAQPLAVSEDASSNIYLGIYPPRILRVTPTATSTATTRTVAGNGILGLPGQGDGNSALAALLQLPSALFLDALDDIFVVDSLNVRAIDTTSTPQSLGGKSIQPGDIQSITGEGLPSNALLVNNLGTIYYALNQNQIVALLQGIVAGSGNPPSGSYPYTAADVGDGGPATSANFWYITSICSDNQGNLFITDDGTFTVRVVNTGTGPITVAGIKIQPQTINTVAGGGPLPTLFEINHLFFTAQQIGDGGPATSALILPIGCFVDGLGNIFIADQYNDRIRRVDQTTGIIDTVAGGQFPGFSGDGGPPKNASLNYPTSIWGDQAGNLLISDSGNNRVREIASLLPVPIASISCSNCSLTNSTGSNPKAVLTLSNTGAAPLILSVSPSLADSTDFTISSSTCTAGMPGVQPNTSCTVTVSVPAAAAASASTNLIIADNAYWSNMNPSSGPTPDPNHLGQVSGYLQSTPINFTFTPPAATVGPATLIFTAVNTPQPVTISNTGTVALTVNSVTWPSFIGAVASGTTCPTTLPFTLSPSTSCSESFAFNPSSSGSGSVSYSGNVSLSFNTTPASQAIPITAYALVATGSITLTLSNSSPSTPATANLSLMGVGSTQFSPQCVVTPAGLNANCAYSQSNQTITATVTIPSCVQAARADLFPGRSWPLYLTGVATIVVLLVPPRYSHRRHRVFIALAIALLCYTMTGLTACANSSTANPGSCVASIAPGTQFALNVTASSASGLTLGLPTPVQITVNK